MQIECKEKFLKFLRDEKQTSLRLQDDGYSDDLYGKIKYNDRFDYITESIGNVDVLNGKMTVLGVYDNKEDKIYLAYTWGVKDCCCDIMGKPIYDLVNEIIDESDKAFAEYIYNNYEYFKECGKPIYDKYMAVEENYNYMKDIVVGLYKKNQEVPHIDFKLDISDNIISTIDIITKYLENKEDFFKSKINEKLNQKYIVCSPVSGVEDIKCSFRENIGFRLLKIAEMIKLMNELKNDKNNPQTKLRNICNAISNKDMKTINVTISKDNKELTFKYETASLQRLFFDDWYIKDVAKRSDFKDLFKGISNSEERMKYITKITYGKKELYKEN